MKDELMPEAIELGGHDALVIVDVQKDFLPGGKLAVARGDEVVPVLNRYIELALSKGMAVYATRDWHPRNHISFKERGGPWPPHCVVDTEGAQFADDLLLPSSAVIISKGWKENEDTYSGFQGTDLDQKLRSAGIQRLLIGGLATDYCVLNTVKDALRLGFGVFLLTDAIKAVNINPEDGKKAQEEMISLGAIPVKWDVLKRSN